jgi:hypothetical protein
MQPSSLAVPMSVTSVTRQLQNRVSPNVVGGTREQGMLLYQSVRSFDIRHRVVHLTRGLTATHKAARKAAALCRAQPTGPRRPISAR